MPYKKRKVDEASENTVSSKKAKKTDLVKEKKIQWLQMTFDEWFEETKYETFYVWYLGGKYEYGVWKGEDDLTSDDLKHFDNFKSDYFYYGHPDYCVHDCITLKEHAWEDGDAKISVIERSYM